jgi:peptide deformylase
LILRVRRPSWIQAKYTNKDGQVVEERFEGLTARCYLHELDHMNGVVFTEKVGKVSLDKAKRKQAKLIKTVARRKRA